MLANNKKKTLKIKFVLHTYHVWQFLRSFWTSLHEYLKIGRHLWTFYADAYFYIFFFISNAFDKIELDFGIHSTTTCFCSIFCYNWIIDRFMSIPTGLHFQEALSISWHKTHSLLIFHTRTYIFMAPQWSSWDI